MTKKISFLILGLIISILANSQNWTQIGSSIDGEFEGDYFSQSLSLNSDGSILAVGAPWNDENGDNAGNVRVFQNNSGNWEQIGDNISGEIAGDKFGYSIGINSSGDIVAIGATQSSNGGTGYVKIYQNNSGTWEQIGDKIIGDNADDGFGKSISINDDGSIIAIGAPWNDNIANSSGLVKIFQNNADTWEQIGETLYGNLYMDNYGNSVSLSGNGTILAIGVPSHDGGTGFGYTAIYQNIGGTWTQVGDNIDAENGGDMFGVSVSLNTAGSIVAIGGTWANENNSGHVKIFQNIDDTWTQMGNTINGETANDYSGYSVSLNSDGNTIAIGSPWTVDYGNVRVFEYADNNWSQLGMNIEGSTVSDGFGCSISLNSSGNIVAVGAESFDDIYNNAGQAKIFENITTNINKISKDFFIFYPNPTNGIVNFEFAENNIKRVTVSDITGKQLIEITEIQQNKQIDLSGFDSGIYLINIQTNNEIFTTKIIKK